MNTTHPASPFYLPPADRAKELCLTLGGPTPAQRWAVKLYKVASTPQRRAYWGDVLAKLGKLTHTWVAPW